MDKRKKSDVGSSKGVKRPTAPYLHFTAERKKQLPESAKLDKETRAQLKREYDELPLEEKARYVELTKKQSEDYRASNPKNPREREGSQTRIQIPILRSIIQRLNDDQVMAVKEIGFGGVLDLKCTGLERGLCDFLAKSYDVHHHSLHVHGKVLEFSTSDVENILGIKDDGLDVVLHRSDREQYVLDGFERSPISLKKLRDRLLVSEGHDMEFKYYFALFLFGAFLCPTTESSISRDYLNFLHPERISSFNWAKYVMKFLEKGLSKMQEKNRQSPNGCLLLLQIKYLDHIGTPANVEVVPRIGAWGDSEIKERMTYLKSVGGYMSSEFQMDPNEPPNIDSIKAVAAEVSKQTLPPIEHQIAEVKGSIGAVKQQLTEVKDGMEESKRQIVASIPRFDDLVNAVTKEVTKSVTKLLGRHDGSSRDTIGYSPDPITPTGSPPLPSPVRIEVPVVAPSPAPSPVAKPSPVARPANSSNIADRVKRKDKRRPSAHQISPYVGGIVKKKKIGVKGRGGQLKISEGGKSSDEGDNLADAIHRYVHHVGADLGEILVDVRGMGFYLTRKEILESMGDGKWITGVVISTLAALLTAEAKAKVSNDASTEPLSWYLSSYFMLDMLRDDESVERLKKKYSCFMHAPNRCQKIFIPMNIANQHWYMAVVLLQERKVEILDSLRAGKKEDTARRKTVETVVNRLAKVLGDEYEYAGKFKCMHADWVPEQPNGYDCGVFVMKMMSADLTEDNALDLLTYDSVTERRKILERIILSSENERFDVICNRIIR